MMNSNNMGGVMRDEIPTLPHNLEAERAVLVAILLDNSTVNQASELLSGSDFYLTSHRLIFLAMLNLFGQGEAIDPITLHECLNQRDQLRDVGGAAYLAELVGAVPNSSNVRSHARVVRDEARKRKMYRGAYALLEATKNGDPVESLEGLVRELSGPKREEAIQPASDSFPVLDKAALYGLAGEVVEAIDPYTEAHHAAVLFNVLTALGNMIGPESHMPVSHDAHPGRLFVVLVGESAKGRKGSGWTPIRFIFTKCDEEWSRSRIKSGLSSGEGLIFNVRDPIWKREPIREKGRVIDYQDVEADPGEIDKRLLIVESEFASTLTVMNRDGNILSEIVRQAWDNGDLSPLTKKDPIKATGAHISIIGHITKDELIARLDDTSKGNGFANRFLWVMVKRSKPLPDGAEVPSAILNPLIEQLSKVFTFARRQREITRDEEAGAYWRDIYEQLSDGKEGLLGAVTNRAEAQVVRLSVLYALLDQSAKVRLPHLKAAVAAWEYCEESARCIFGRRLGDPTADRILEALRQAGTKGLRENDIYELFGRNKSAIERVRALQRLQSLGLAFPTQCVTGGRPATVWKATRST